MLEGDRQIPGPCLDDSHSVHAIQVNKLSLTETALLVPGL
jgi:hypothetical protein